MGIYFNPGNEIFSESVNSNIYVDKSMLIEFTSKVMDTKQKDYTGKVLLAGINYDKKNKKHECVFKIMDKNDIVR